MTKEKMQWLAVNFIYTVVYIFCIAVLFMDALVWRPN